MQTTSHRVRETPVEYLQTQNQKYGTDVAQDHQL